ncbi:capsular polysaccharide biosynthesis protein [Oceaniserpentilla sp. 4NH20-0058]|uniref:capsular polysaccharide biosynthesis protein n=1 Tax=Oceaniserpentilla sp. 4NH20-0058 TaxID=3127660 RepID=UPI00310BCA99
MAFYTSSRGIINNPQISRLLKTNGVRLLSFSPAKKADGHTLVGWGYKPTAQLARDVAQKNGTPYWALEDGFISWLSHPSLSKPYQRLSYIIDRVGIYYDASKPSGLDQLLEDPAELDDGRVSRLIEQLNTLKISKYNHKREAASHLDQSLITKPYLLLVDQTYGDASIEHSGGTERSFNNLLDWALLKLAEDPTLNCVVKIHPDVLLGQKKGYLFELLAIEQVDGGLSDRIHLLAEDYSPADLICYASEVGTVSSQLGFEALWQHKPVTCFAWPFYAGRGLTQDKCDKPLKYARKSTTLHELIDAAIIRYPTYLHPDTQEPCEVEAIVDYLQAHFQLRDMSCQLLSAPNFSLWKRSFIPEFIAQSANKITFLKRKRAEQTLIWGMKQPEVVDCWRIEDGFIRSVGLGADLRRPSSLVVDKQGIYYNGKQASDLEGLLDSYQLNEYEQVRAEKLISQLKHSDITKYNVESADDVEQIKLSAGDRAIVLVTGQFQQDLSMEFGAIDIKDNLSLLKQVRCDYPDAYIIYKEHPDVYSGVRPGRLSDAEVKQFADLYLSSTSLLSLFAITDRLCTICSLAGFEALIRGVSVSTYGLPFYGGWGLTQDNYSYPRRNKKVSVNELVYITLVLYSRYVNWETRSITAVESTISQIVCDKVLGMKLKTIWYARQWRKIRYFAQAIFKTHGFAKKDVGVGS